MQLKPKLFLVLAAFCTAPLLLLSAFSFLTTLNTAHATLRADLEQELTRVNKEFQTLVRDRDRDLLRFASNDALVDQIRNTNPSSTQTNELPPELRTSLSRLFQEHESYAAIAAFLSNNQPLFGVERSSSSAAGEDVFRLATITANDMQPDASAWTTKPGSSVCKMLTKASVGQTLRCATPLTITNDIQGLLVFDSKLDSMLAETAKGAEISRGQEGGGGFIRMAVALDQSGGIVYHTNDALKHQQVAQSAPYFLPVANSMIGGGAGAETYKAPDGDEWLAVYAPLQSPGLSLALVHNRSLAVAGVRRVAWLSILASLLLGAGLALLLALYYRRKTQSFERVTQDVAAIAKGELDLHIDARSRDDIRPLADSVNLMTEQLRHQIAREAETRQFQSFVRLSAMLTHDLKNAIGSLSLLVSNMEEHFNNEQFRADAMKSLTNATQKLQSLVDRISNPVTTLSGEFKRPGPVDLVPIIRRTVNSVAEPLGTTHEVSTDLPSSLVALVDAERIEKVVENLVLNAFESMSGKSGKLTVVAGSDQNGQVYFSVSDTGQGMSQTFIDEKLFHAFATTKKKGMGLGLYTCREVVRAHGGSIEVDSKQGVGTTFRVVLPSRPAKKSFSKAERKFISSQI